MTGEAIVAAYVFILAIFVGFEVVLGTANVVGGFVVTDRMLAMFKQRPARKRE